MGNGLNLYMCMYICKLNKDHKSNLNLKNTRKLNSLMEIKGFSQCIAAKKQQWCGLVAADSCGIVAACEFFVCKLVLLLLVAAMLRLLVAATLRLLVAATLWLLVAAILRLFVAATLRLLVAATLQIFVCRECVGLSVIGYESYILNSFSYLSPI